VAHPEVLFRLADRFFGSAAPEAMVMLVSP